MSDPSKTELARFLREQVQEWNRLRQQFPAYRPDLSGIQLAGAHLGEIVCEDIGFVRGVGGDDKNAPVRICREDRYFAAADLSRAILRNAILRKANLDGVELSDADLRGADLRKSRFRANLVGADLRDADLRNANLSLAHLRRADLSYADLTGAVCQYADFREANLTGANLSQADMRNVIFADATGRAANLSKAILKDTLFTQEDGDSVQGGFLELASVENLETAIFNDPADLYTYLERAFNYAHRSDIAEARKYPDFFQVALDKIKALRPLYRVEQPPGELIEIISLVATDLIKHIAEHPESLYQIRPRQFEELIAELLAGFGWDVRLTASTKDGGFDVFAISKDISGLQSSWIIECKKYAADRRVGIDIARALYGVKNDRRVANAMLATTSYFTRGVNAFKSERYDFHLRDYESILDWISRYRPNPDGKIYIENNALIQPEKR